MALMNILEDLKALRKSKFNVINIQSYIIQIMENFFYSMFDYKNFPKSMPKEYAERYLIWYGEVAAGKVPEEYNKGIYKGEAVFLHSNTAGGDDGVGLDIYGLGNQVIVTGCNGFNDVAGFDKYAVGFNNSAHKSLRKFIILSSEAISKALLSLRSGIDYSKNHPIYKARDDKEQAALKEYWKKVQNNDDELAIASNNIWDDLIESEGNVKIDKVINLSDPELADKLQYIAKTVDDYLRWCCSLYGQNIQGNGKLAQQTVDEVNGQTSFSFVLPNDMLYQRKQWLERMKELNLVPADADIDFSRAWKVEEVKYEKEADINEDGDIEEVTETAETEEVTEKEGEEDEETVV